MNITKAKYFQDIEPTGSTPTNVSISATIDGQYVSVPMDVDNRHYVEILRQVEAGELTIAAAD